MNAPTITPEDDRRFVMVVYDIPQKSHIQNPSDKLKRFAFRINLSCWIMPQYRLPFALIDSLKARGADVEVVRFDLNEEKAIRALAKKALAREVQELRESLADKLPEKMAEVQRMIEANEHTSETGEEALKGLDSFIKMRLWRAKRSIESAMEAATVFALTQDVSELFDAARADIAATNERFLAAHAQKTIESANGKAQKARA